MTKVKVTFTEYDQESGYHTIEYENIHSVSTHPSGLVVRIEFMDGSIIMHPWSRIRTLRTS